MLSLSPATRIFVALEPVDMRKSFNGLSASVETVLAQDVASGHLFLFTNRLRNRVKALYFDGSGLVLYTKRLEHGRFGWPTGDGASRRLRPEELTLLLHGIEGRPRAHWYRRRSKKPRCALSSTMSSRRWNAPGPSATRCSPTSGAGTRDGAGPATGCRSRSRPRRSRWSPRPRRVRAAGSRCGGSAKRSPRKPISFRPN